MNYRTAGGFRDALERRLRDRSEESGIPIVRLRKAVVFDRLLARLLHVGPDRWLVKGALALDFRLGSVTRTTMDMDLGYAESRDAAEADLIEAQTVYLEDYFEFSLVKIRTSGTADPSSASYQARAEVAGRIFEEVTVDIGSADAIDWKTEHVLGTNLLKFAEIDRMNIPLLPLEQHVAEKVHAYTRTYADGLPSSRVKDLIDMVLIKSLASLDAGKLREALEVTFEVRALQRLPESLPPPPADWPIPYKKLATQVGLDEDLALGFAEAAKLLDPVLSNSAKGSWDPNTDKWSLD